MLDLRSVYQQAASSQPSETMSSLDFEAASRPGLGAVTASVVGNMGAPLRADVDHDLGDAEIHFSSDPFSFGLRQED